MGSPTLFSTVTLPADATQTYRRIVASEQRLRRVVVSPFAGPAVFVGVDPGSSGDPISLLFDTVVVALNAPMTFMLLPGQALFMTSTIGAGASASISVSDAICVS